MTAVDKIRELCAEKKISIAKLERSCGFSNGYIRGLRAGQLPVDKLEKVAEFLEVPMDVFLEKPSGAWYMDENAARVAQELHDRPGMRILFDAARDVSDEGLIAVAKMIERFKKGNENG